MLASLLLATACATAPTRPPVSIGSGQPRVDPVTGEVIGGPAEETPGEYVRGDGGLTPNFMVGKDVKRAAVLLPFNDDLSIDEASYRAHLRDVCATEGISAITVNAHASAVLATAPMVSTRSMPKARQARRMMSTAGLWAGWLLKTSALLGSAGNAVLGAKARIFTALRITSIREAGIPQTLFKRSKHKSSTAT